MLSNHRDFAAGKLTHLCLAVIHKDSGDWVGWCGLDNREDTGEGPALFYVVRTSHRSRGFATEAARAVLVHALNEINLPQVLARTRADNPASRRVLDKIGMRYLGTNREGEHAYVLTRKEFLNIR
jgi:RimJ/RimL family protein N-acetyltransferase